MTAPLFAAVVTALFLPSAPVDPDDGVFTAQASFRIPLDLTDAERARTKAVRLFVSENQGATWNLAGEGDAAQPFVAYQAPRDGRYWFSVALVDAAGVQAPRDVALVPPGLKVVVDAVKPTLNLKPVRSRAGRHGVKYDYSDANIDPASLRVAVQSRGTGRWTACPLGDPKIGVAWCDAAPDVGKFQATVRDRSGNTTVVQVEITGDRFTKQTVDAFALDVEPADLQPVPTKALPIEPPSIVAAPPPPSTSESNPPGMLDPAVMAAVAALKVDVRPTEKSPPPAFVKAAASVAEERLMEPTPADAASSGIAAKSTAAKPTKEPTAAADKEKTTILSVRRVVAAYELEAAAEGVVRQVVLWGRHETEGVWRKLGVDEDLKSPVEADVPQDGRWGLTVALSNSLSNEEPKLDDVEPDLFVEIDTVSPALELMDPKPSLGTVEVTWTADDRNLADRPMTLSYAPEATGPWKIAAENLENTGRYVWNFKEAEVLGRFFLRLEARDRAGNTSVGASRGKVLLTNTQPKGRVVGVEGKK
ncbi:MAG: hypothetical protein ACRC1K_25415 [Planctomycetia bacterium]